MKRKFPTQGKRRCMKLKGKIPIITHCLGWPRCRYVSTDKCNKPHQTCKLVHREIFYEEGIPEWCPLPDVDKLMTLLGG